MDKPEKLATQVTQDKEKNKNKKKPQRNVRWTPLSASKHKQR
jgi:hypothetical protein